jgi:hypothetical protein
MQQLDDILESLIDSTHGDFSIELARHVLQMRFPDARAARYEELAEKNQHGLLTPSETEELEAFVTANSVLMILKSKARRSLVKHSSAA